MLRTDVICLTFIRNIKNDMDHLSEPEMEKLLILQQREIDAMQIALVQKQREAGM